MADGPQPDTAYAVECPHCHKQFQGRLLAGASARHSGFKCPHCRLFIPLERVAGALPEPT